MVLSRNSKQTAKQVNGRRVFRRTSLRGAKKRKTNMKLWLSSLKTEHCRWHVNDRFTTQNYKFFQIKCPKKSSLCLPPSTGYGAKVNLCHQIFFPSQNSCWCLETLSVNIDHFLKKWGDWRIKKRLGSANGKMISSGDAGCCFFQYINKSGNKLLCDHLF